MRDYNDQALREEVMDQTIFINNTLISIENYNDRRGLNQSMVNFSKLNKKVRALGNLYKDIVYTMDWDDAKEIERDIVRFKAELVDDIKTDIDHLNGLLQQLEEACFAETTYG